MKLKHWTLSAAKTKKMHRQDLARLKAERHRIKQKLLATRNHKKFLEKAKKRLKAGQAHLENLRKQRYFVGHGSVKKWNQRRLLTVEIQKQAARNKSRKEKVKKYTLLVKKNKEAAKTRAKREAE